MSRGRKRHLVDLVLTARFRAERHGGLVLEEMLPAMLPTRGDEQAQAAWSHLCRLQSGYRETGGRTFRSGMSRRGLIGATSWGRMR